MQSVLTVWCFYNYYAKGRYDSLKCTQEQGHQGGEGGAPLLGTVKRDYADPAEHDHLSVKKAQRVHVLDDSDANWWWARDNSDNAGWVPAEYVTLQPTVRPPSIRGPLSALY